LFVSAKAPTGFTVREAQGGRDSVSFDYRIVAPALGHSKERLQLVAGTALGPSHLKMPKTKYFLPKIIRMRFPLPKR
jgi:hypothetical protein